MNYQPLFKINEEVILQSNSFPECNGEYVILEIRKGNDNYAISKDGIVDVGTPWGYVLNIEHPIAGCWSEISLRKKHKPSEDSYESMINKLKQQDLVSCP